MRRRGFDKDESPAAAPGSARKQVESVFKSLDMYSNRKIAAEFTTAPSTAAKVSLTVGHWVMALLFLCELLVFLRVEERDHVVVDRSMGQRLKIGLNITFPALTCAEVHLDAMDVAGDYHPYMEQHMTKQRLDGRGAPIPHRAIPERANEYEHGPEDTGSGCQSCFGAETAEQPCCNTCDELLRAYGNKGWSAQEIKKEAPQCVDDTRDDSIRAIKKGEGCNLAGWLEVNKVAGNVHVAMGESAIQNGRFVHQFDPTRAPEFNVSHVIHDLAFGETYDGMALPLSGTSRIVDAATGTGLFQYFIKLVPTIYRAAPDAAPVRTVRYSYTQRFRPLHNQPPSQEELVMNHLAHAKATSPTAMLPGIFLVYDFSAFMVEVTRHRSSVAHFLVRVCAIVGGVSTVVAFVDWAVVRAKRLYC